MRGITLLAVGGNGYLEWAINQATTLRFHSPDLPIQLITSNEIKPYADTANSFYGLFNTITVVDDTEFMTDGKMFPAKLKTNLYKFLQYDETIYLDVDGCTIADVSPLFSIKSDFASDVQGVHTLLDGSNFEAMKWAKPGIVWMHFGLPETAGLPAINSSFMFIRKGEMCKKIFETAHNLLLSNPLPPDQHWYPWGKNRKTKINQPDELYFNVACAVLGVLPEHKCAVHFRMSHEAGEYQTIESLSKNYFGIGLFGQLRSNHSSLQELYNKHVRTCWKALNEPKTGAAFSAKCEILSQSKFVET